MHHEIKTTTVMNYPLLTWSCIAGLTALIIIVRIIRAAGICMKGRHPFIEIGSERDEFFVPGDPRETDEYDDEDDYCL